MVSVSVSLYRSLAFPQSEYFSITFLFFSLAETLELVLYLSLLALDLLACSKNRPCRIGPLSLQNPVGCISFHCSYFIASSEDNDLCKQKPFKMRCSHQRHRTILWHQHIRKVAGLRQHKVEISGASRISRALYLRFYVSETPTQLSVQRSQPMLMILWDPWSRWR